MPTVIRPTWKPTDEQAALLDRARDSWARTQQAQDAAKALEEEAWRLTQAARVVGVPDLAICEQIEQVSKPTLNRRLGPRTPRSAGGKGTKPGMPGPCDDGESE